MNAKRRFSLLAAASMAVAVAGPAVADTSAPVTVVGVGGTRMLYVEDVSGQPLTGLNLGTGGAQPFRTHVVDSSFVPAASGGNYSVNATLNNLYLKTSTGHDFTTKVPSSAVSINFGTSPLSETGLSIADLPKLAISGALTTCANLSSTLKSALGLDSSGNVIGSNLALTTLCGTLTTAAATAPAPTSATVPAAVQTVTPLLSSVADLPTALSGAIGGTFTNPSYDGIGAGDPNVSSPPAATQVPLMQGTTAASLSANLVTALTNALNISSPLTATSGSALTDTGRVTAQLSGSTDTVTSELGAVLTTLSSANQVSAINEIFQTIAVVAPALADIQGMTGNAYAFPILKSTPTTPIPGTYSGTMTVTFVQS